MHSTRATQSIGGQRLFLCWCGGCTRGSGNVEHAKVKTMVLKAGRRERARCTMWNTQLKPKWRKWAALAAAAVVLAERTLKLDWLRREFVDAAANCLPAAQLRERSREEKRKTAADETLQLRPKLSSILNAQPAPSPASALLLLRSSGWQGCCFG